MFIKNVTLYDLALIQFSTLKPTKAVAESFYEYTIKCPFCQKISVFSFQLLINQGYQQKLINEKSLGDPRLL